MWTMEAADGTRIRGYDGGRGPAILVVGPGLDDGRRTERLADLLSTRFRVLRLHRRRYRLDLRSTRGPCTLDQEVEDVLAVARRTGPPLGGPGGAVTTRARAGIAAGRPGRALAVFMRGAVGLKPWQARLAGAFSVFFPRYRALVPSQIDDLEVMDRLGARLDAYAGITVPTLLLSGDRSPAHPAERVDAIERVLPRAERLVLRDRDHGADLKAPKELAHLVGAFAAKVVRKG